MAHKRDEHRPGVSEENLVTRHLKLEPADPQAVLALISDIDHLYGMDEVSFDEQSRMLTLVYDATRLSMGCIVGMLGKSARVGGTESRKVTPEATSGDAPPTDADANA